MRLGETARFFIPVVLLCAFTGYTGQKLVRSHFPDKVKETSDYDHEEEAISTRGTIYDSTMIDASRGRPYPLVKSSPRWEFRLDPVAMTGTVVRARSKDKPRTVEAQARTIASLLKMKDDYEKILAKCRKYTHRNQFLGYTSEQRVHDLMMDKRYVAGIKERELPYRHYYEGSRLAHVLRGIDERYNRELRGVPGRIRYKRDVHNQPILEKPIEKIPAVRGASVYLTIDHRLQREAEDSLAWGIEEYGAARGWCVILDSATGEVLAMASNPTYDPRYPASVPDDIRRNLAISFTYEPGSVMKVVTAAAAIECGHVTPNTMYNTDRYEKTPAGEPRYYKLPGDGSHVWDPKMPVRDAIARSSNIVMGKIAYEIGPSVLLPYMEKFGFGAQTGIELPLEERGILLRKGKKEWDKATRSRAGIGQGVMVTPIQVAGAYQALANDGLRIPPRIVKKVVYDSGSEAARPVYAPPVRVVSAKTARSVREMMLGVASPKGTARRAALQGYSVAGKTGTAQKVRDGKYAAGLYTASFCGIVPSGVVKRDESDYAPAPPRVVILVTLDFDEKRTFHQGGNSAGPVFRRVAKGAMRILEVPPDRPDEFIDADEEYDDIMDKRAAKVAEEDPVWDGVPLWLAD